MTSQPSIEETIARVLSEQTDTPPGDYAYGQIELWARAVREALEATGEVNWRSTTTTRDLKKKRRFEFDQRVLVLPHPQESA